MAVESLRDWPGVIGLFGGNPCNHPKFPELCKILAEIIPDQRRRGLWSNDLLGHGEIVRETFFPGGRFNLNAHGVLNAAGVIERHLPGRLIPGSDVRQAEHAAILVDYRDLNLSPADWEQAREGCDINRKWSGAIVERIKADSIHGMPFAYFCEVAAAIDGIRGTNNGIPAVPGWWRLPIEEPGFQDQIRKCCDSGCGVPLKFKGHADNAEVYDITPGWLPVLQEQKQVALQTHVTIPGTVKENTDYMKVRS